MIRAFLAVKLSGTFPATAVSARRSSRSLAPKAKRMATASSCPGSVSIIIGRLSCLDMGLCITAINRIDKPSPSPGRDRSQSDIASLAGLFFSPMATSDPRDQLLPKPTMFGIEDEITPSTRHDLLAREDARLPNSADRHPALRLIHNALLVLATADSTR